MTAAGPIASPLHFEVDCSLWRDQPLVKDKFGVYQTPFLSLDDLERAAHPAGNTLQRR